MLMILAWISGAFLLAIASPALAGGFQISVETPARSSDPQLKDAVLITRTFGCHQPSYAKLSASAEGLVDGNRKSLPLELRAIGSGVYAINKQWPSEGTWVLALSGAYNGMISSVIVQLGPNGSVLPGTRLEEGRLEGVNAKGARRSWAAKDIDAALRLTTSAASQDSKEQDYSDLSLFGPFTWLFAGFGASLFAIGFVRRKRLDRASSVGRR